MTDQEYAEFILNNQHLTLQKIALILGVAHTTIIFRNKKLGLIKQKAKTRPKVFSRKVNFMAFKQYIEGFEGTDKEAAEHFGVSVLTILTLRKKLGAKRLKGYVLDAI
jgi:Zn-dependent peptidase ImmA (M78 family)